MRATSLRRILQWQARLADFVRAPGLVSDLFWAGLVGLCGGLAALGFRKAVDAVPELVTGYGGDITSVFAHLPEWLRLVVPTVGGLLAGLVLHYGMRLARGSPSTDYMEAIALGDGVIGARPSLVKSVSSLLSITSGGSIGREGPMVQLSAMLGSLVRCLWRFSEPRLRLLVACGAAAGIAAAYNAPIAGALFVGEIVLGSIAMRSFGPLLFASVIATLTTRSFLGDKPIYEILHFRLVSSWELLFYLLLGIAGGVAAPAFLRLLRGSERLFRKVPGPVYVRMALGGLIVGGLASLRPEVCGNGQAVVHSVLSVDWMWDAVLLMLAFKLVATAATAGSGAVGGVFTPTLFVGAMLGTLVGQLAGAAGPGATAPPAAYALVGMGALLAGTTHAPLMAILMVFELTLSYEIVLPLMLACVVAYGVSTHLGKEGIYAEALRRKGPPVPPLPVADLRVRDLMRPELQKVPETERFAALAETFVGGRFRYLYVVDDEDHLRGTISLHDVLAHLGDEHLGEMVIASDVMRGDVPFLTEDDTLQEALHRFTGHLGERLPVVRDLESRELRGSISKADLLLTLAHGVGAQESAPPRSQI